MTPEERTALALERIANQVDAFHHRVIRYLKWYIGAILLLVAIRVLVIGL